MFRLNGDIIKQLENIYKIKFLPKYKEELKNRILAFVSSFIFDLKEKDILITLEFIKKDIIIENNSIKFLSSDFINNNKQTIFNSFNPLWYQLIEPSPKFSPFEKQQMFNLFFSKKYEEAINNVFLKLNIEEIFDNFKLYSNRDHVYFLNKETYLEHTKILKIKRVIPFNKTFIKLEINKNGLENIYKNIKPPCSNILIDLSGASFKQDKKVYLLKEVHNENLYFCLTPNDFQIKNFIEYLINVEHTKLIEDFIK